jgi:hypothetical protein
VTEYPSPHPRRRRTRRPSARAVRALLAAIGVVVVFGAGLALGMALHDNPKPGGTITYVRTFVPSAP